MVKEERDLQRSISRFLLKSQFYPPSPRMIGHNDDVPLILEEHMELYKTIERNTMYQFCIDKKLGGKPTECRVMEFQLFCSQKSHHSSMQVVDRQR